MFDKVELRVPYSASFRPEFKWVEKEVRYANFYSPVRPSANYQGVVDLRPFGLDAILHAYYKRGGSRDHKLELLHTGSKSLRQLAEIVAAVFCVDVPPLKNMRLDFASDMYGIPVTHLYDAMRVKHKRKSNGRGELDYETVGARRLEYFRYGKAPNCIRVYDKPAECKARMPQILKRVSPDAELPTFEDLFGFAEDTTMARVERQAGGGRIPEQLATFGQLVNGADFDPFPNIEILPISFPFPDPHRHGVAKCMKLIGINECIRKYGYQQARSMLNCEGNAKRMLDDYEEYLRESKAAAEVTVEQVVESYRKSVQKQIDGSIEKPVAFAIPLDGSLGAKHNDCHNEIA